MNFWLRFPKGTIPLAAMPSSDMALRLRTAITRGLLLAHRDDDLFEAVGLSEENWRRCTRTCREMFPEASFYQKL